MVKVAKCILYAIFSCTSIHTTLCTKPGLLSWAYVFDLLKACVHWFLDLFGLELFFFEHTYSLLFYPAILLPGTGILMNLLILLWYYNLYDQQYHQYSTTAYYHVLGIYFKLCSII